MPRRGRHNRSIRNTYFMHSYITNNKRNRRRSFDSSNALTLSIFEVTRTSHILIYLGMARIEFLTSLLRAGQSKIGLCDPQPHREEIDNCRPRSIDASMLRSSFVYINIAMRITLDDNNHFEMPISLRSQHTNENNAVIVYTRNYPHAFLTHQLLWIVINKIMYAFAARRASPRHLKQPKSSVREYKTISRRSRSPGVSIMSVFLVADVAGSGRQRHK